MRHVEGQADVLARTRNYEIRTKNSKKLESYLPYLLMNQVAAGVHQLLIKRMVNVYFVETSTPGKWVLIDTGLAGSEKEIIAAADQLYGPSARPEAIFLTHGHPDHGGAAKELASHWGVAVIVHPLELPYLTAKALYPPSDPTVGGFLAFISRFLPHQLPDLTDVVQTLPLVEEHPPYLEQWRWLLVPGHAPGQVAFFREADRTLLGGDAFGTTNDESLVAVLLMTPEIRVNGSPYNYNWTQCRASVQRLADLEPITIACGHGPVIRGPQAAAGLHHLAANYPLPAQGRYLAEPARLDASGVEYLPPKPPDKLPKQAAAVGVGLLLAGAAWLLVGSQRKKRSAPKRVKSVANTRYQPPKGK
jgi:glyoxylase-like metal-dependent hydrolase (beta-lactamase superfamily II)